MKRLLLISQMFPPEPSPGALRPGYLAKYLPEFGWNVTVLTQTELDPPFAVKVLRTRVPAPLQSVAVPSAIRKSAFVMGALRAARDTLLFPDLVAPWIPAAIRTGNTALESETFTAIMSTAMPASVHVIASALAKRSGLPWIADYRDPWAGNSYVQRGLIRTKLEHAFERRLLREAAAITTVSEPIALQLAAFHHRNDVHVIPNAYDEAEWSGIPQATPERFDLCFTGSMYDGRRSPDALFAALAQLRQENDPAGLAARIHFYGRNTANVARSATEHGVSPIVREHGIVPRDQAMRAQRASAALLIFLNMDDRTSGEMGSKYLEYLGARRPIIACGPRNSVMKDFIQRNELGWFASTPEEARMAVRSAYERFTSGVYEVPVPSEGVSTSRELARSFARVLDANAANSSAVPRRVA